MSKRAQKKLQAGLDQVENFFESTVETHMGMLYLLAVRWISSRSSITLIDLLF